MICSLMNSKYCCIRGIKHTVIGKYNSVSHQGTDYFLIIPISSYFPVPSSYFISYLFMHIHKI